MIRDAGEIKLMKGLNAYFYIPGPGQVTIAQDRVWSLVDRGILIEEGDWDQTGAYYVLDETVTSREMSR